MKKIYLLIICLLCSSCSNALPKAQPMDNNRGQTFGVDKNIHEATLDKYLFRSDVVYRDMRMLIDPASYSAIGGDSYLSGFVQGFEVVPLPYIIPISNLPPDVGVGYVGPTLFSEVDGNMVANYTNSQAIIEFLFPKDKAIFLMCGGAGYAGMMKNFLVSLGWNKDRVYNTGGYWYYEGKYNVEVKRTVAGVDYYDFWKVAYHDINFAELELV